MNGRQQSVRVWRRIAYIVPALLVLLAAPAAPVHGSQPDCAPQPLAAGGWSGRFEVQWDLRWTADLSTPPPGPAAWQGTRTIRGEIDLVVNEAPAAGTPAVTGTARALWRGETVAEREDGARRSRFERGWLTGGALMAPAGRNLAAGDTIEWPGAWWTAPVPEENEVLAISATGTDRAPNGATLFSDGVTPSRPAGPLRFQVTSVTCREITGTADPALFGYPELGPEVGVTVVSATATFTLSRN